MKKPILIAAMLLAAIPTFAQEYKIEWLQSKGGHTYAVVETEHNEFLVFRTNENLSRNDTILNLPPYGGRLNMEYYDSSQNVVRFTIVLMYDYVYRSRDRANGAARRWMHGDTKW